MSAFPGGACDEIQHPIPFGAFMSDAAFCDAESNLALAQWETVSKAALTEMDCLQRRASPDEGAG